MFKIIRQQDKKAPLVAEWDDGTGCQCGDPNCLWGTLHRRYVELQLLEEEMKCQET